MIKVRSSGANVTHWNNNIPLINNIAGHANLAS